MGDNNPVPVALVADEAAEERKQLSYQGTSLPLAVILMWLLYFVFGFIYFTLYILRA